VKKGWFVFAAWAGFILVQTAAAQPVNNFCVDANDIFLDVPIVGSTLSATGSDISSCSSADSADVWFAFDAPETSLYTFSLCNSDIDFDTTLSLFNGCGGSELGCDDDACDLQSSITMNLDGGSTTWVRIAGYAGETGQYEVEVTQVIGSGGNDGCLDANSLVEGLPHSGSTVGATGADISSCADNDDVDVWHTFTPESTTFYNITLCNSDFDTTLAVYDSCGGSQIACNDDFCGSDELQAGVSVLLMAAQTYRIRVAGYEGDTGAYEILVEEDICELPNEPNFPSPADSGSSAHDNTLLSWFDLNPPKPKNKAKKTSSKVGKLIYGSDDRQDEYEIFDAALKAAGDATVVLVSRSSLTDNGNGTLTLDDPNFADDYFNRNGVALCPDEPYANQPAPGFCSGFLVGSQTVATAGHCLLDSFDCNDVAFVFGFIMAEPNSPVLTYAASQIYYCDGIQERMEDGLTDWGLIRLDRPVPDHTPLPVRRIGQIELNDPLVVIGHPQGLPRKYANNATVRANDEVEFFQANLDTYGGNSGSAVLNASDLTVEGILVRGNADFVFDEGENCDRSNVCPDSGCPDWEDATRSTEFSERIARFDVYLGTEPESLALICDETTSFLCDPGPLVCGTTYYWQVVHTNVCGSTPGPVWFFQATGSGGPTDFNGNCLTNYVDFALLQPFWMTAGCNAGNGYCQGRDLNQSGAVDLTEIWLMSQAWLSN
jgi:hypothetical protein